MNVLNPYRFSSDSFQDSITSYWNFDSNINDQVGGYDMILPASSGNGGYTSTNPLITTSGIKTEFPCYIDITTNESTLRVIEGIKFYYNGNNLVMKITGKGYFVCDLNFNNQVQVFDNQALINGEINVGACEMVANLNEVYDKYMIGGNSNSLGQFPYYITEDKFIR